MFQFFSDDSPSMLDPQGTMAAHVADLWWLMFFLGTAVFLVVVVLMLLGLYTRRNRETTDENTGNQWIIVGGIVMPAIVLAIVFGFTIRTSLLTSAEADANTLVIEVTGWRWWWEVNYPEQDITTANEIHIPTGVPVEFVLTSGDVIHSFWVPQLHGKMDLVPGKENRLLIQANEPGVYRGECAEFCGLQHARMHFIIIAQSAADFDQWLAAQQEPASQPQNDITVRGQEVFVDAGCVFCHTVRGLDVPAIDPSAVDLGPDLTHLASRTTIGAGTLQNNRGNLSGWILNPHSLKPGVLMPATFISGEEVQALVAYLETLH